MIAVPAYIDDLLTALRCAGFSAYPVGGCVRDGLMGRVPADWDVCTSARPEQTYQVFEGKFRLIETGMKHGTVTVLTSGGPVEVTTFRADGAYLDGRHPESVSFLPDVAGDLARRDFTVNAMALAPSGEIIDPWGGQADIGRRLIRCVGEPDRRFHEDALRILRALRFASKLAFTLEADTARSVIENRALLRAVARERIFAELRGILTGPGAGRVLIDYAPVIFEVVPELAAEAGFDQKSPHHIHDVWTHTALAVDAIAPDPVLRLAMLLHDIGKPECFFTDGAGVGHFYGHGETGAAMADAILRRLRCDNSTRKAVTELIVLHDMAPPQTPKAMRRLLAKVGEDTVRRLIACWRADASDRAEAVRARNMAVIDGAEQVLDGLFEEKAVCFSIKNLAVNGRDIMALGAKEGPAVGDVLRSLFREVVDGTLPNERQALLARAERMLKI